MTEEKKLGKADLHIHSRANDGLATPREVLEYVEHHTDLDVIAITDHDEIQGAFQARELAMKRNYRVQVMVGMEISTLNGHLLALDIHEPIRLLQSLEKTVAAVHRQGGLCIVPHPLSWLTPSVGQRAINRVMRKPSDEIYLDGIEILNPSYAGRVAYKKVIHLNETHWHLAACGGSDSHGLATVGSAHTLFPGHTIADLRQAILERTTQAGGSFWNFSDHYSIAAPQVFRSVIVTPGMRIKKAVTWLLEGQSR
ncbi:MAG: PHP-associated domain-containing protein [Chloroflexota bacterium]